MSKSIRVATDVGGTFTDLVYFETDDETGEQSIRTAKVHTTPPNFDEGVLNVLAKGKVDVGSVAFFAHGTTVVINALTERKGVKTALITTQGFRDVLEIARGNRPDFFNLMYEKPKPFVPRRLRRELPGRMNYRGEETAPLDLSGLPAILDDFRAEGVEAIAICLLHAYANPSHEEALAAEVRRLWPEVAVVASHQITREWREYERTNTTVLSAYVQPIAESYLDRLEHGLKASGARGQLYIMQSNCGVDSLAATKAIPITMVESGPASGFWGAAELGRIIGEPNVLALDIGGTTAKCSLIEGGEVRIMTDYWIERSRRSSGYPVMVPVVDVVEIGNGGGSIAWVDDFGKLHVGPQSAGAIPGPAAYGEGGVEATTTDANIALGRINKDYFFGGEIKADMRAVDAALGRIAGKLGVAPIEAARGIVRIANNNMINALKLVSLNRGYDPRDFTLIAFGGGGAMHAAALGAELGVKKVVIPRSAPVFSAWGMMMSDLRRDYFVTRLIETGAAEPSAVAAAVGALIEEAAGRARGQFAAEGVGAERIRLTPLLKCRYQNQEHSVEAPLAYGPVGASTIADLIARFDAIYEREYTYRLDAPVEIVGLHLVASAEVGKLRLAPLPKTGAALGSARKGRRLVDYALDGAHETEIYDAAKLEPGMSFAGPAIIEDPGTTVVVHPGQSAAIDALGNIHIEEGARMTLIQPIKDPVTFDIIQNSLEAIADEMFAAMRKTAMSAIIYEVLDLGTGITDASGEIAASGAGIPAFIGVLDKAVKAILRKHPRESLAPGDVFAVNDPYDGGVTHLNDIVLAMPVFVDGALVAWTATIAHFNDVGGMVPGSMSTDAYEIFQEGIRIPAIKIIDAGKPNPAVIDIMTVNSRLPAFLKGDLWSGIAAVRIGERRLVELVRKYGVATFEAAISHFMDYGEQVSLKALESLPKGRFELAEEQDDGAVYKVAIEITDKTFVVDLSDNPDQVRGPTNASRDGVIICAQMAFKAFSASSGSANAGSFRPLRVITRPGSIFDPVEPAAIGFYFEVEVRVFDLMLRCLAPHMPGLLPAGGFASICGTVIGGPHPDTGRHYTIVEPQLGGWGAMKGRDGNSAIFSGFHGETFNCPAEVAEARYGLAVDRMILNPEPGGEGRWRGGRGIEVDYRVRADGNFMTVGYTRSRVPPWGLAEGRDGTPNYVEVVRSTGERERYSLASGVIVNKGDVIRIVTGNGGGYGEPEQRDPKAVVDDIDGGYLTPGRAAEVYGIAGIAG